MLQELLTYLSVEQTLQLFLWFVYGSGVLAGIAASAWFVHARRRWPLKRKS